MCPYNLDKLKPLIYNNSYLVATKAAVDEKPLTPLLAVQKDFIITNELAQRVDPKKFEIGTNKFIGCTYRLI